MDYYFVLPETISLQENTQTEVILAIELHCDNPVDDKGNDYKFIENKFFSMNPLIWNVTMGWRRGWVHCWTELKNCWRAHTASDGWQGLDSPAEDNNKHSGSKLKDPQFPSQITGPGLKRGANTREIFSSNWSVNSTTVTGQIIQILAYGFTLCHCSTGGDNVRGRLSSGKNSVHNTGFTM